MSKRLCALFCCYAAMLFSIPSWAAKEDNVGSIRRSAGDAQILRQSKVIKAKTGEAIYNKDILETLKNGFIEVSFLDDSSLRLSKNSKMQITHAEFDDGFERNAQFNFIKGAFNLKTTPMENKPDEVIVQIPMGTIVVKSADVFGGYIENEKFDVALLGTGWIRIDRGDLHSVVRIPGFGLSLSNEGDEAVKPKRQTPEKIKIMQDMFSF